jgi:hypothetical protein
MEEERIKTGMEISPEHKKKLKMRAADTGKHMWELLNEALSLYFGEAAMMREEGNPYLAKLQEILDSSDEQAKEAITKNVSFYYDRRLRAKKRAKRKVAG